MRRNSSVEKGGRRRSSGRSAGLGQGFQTGGFLEPGLKHTVDWSKYTVNVEDQPSCTHEFYTNQNELIDAFIQHGKAGEEEDDDEEEESWSVSLAINLSFGANVVLVILKLLAAILSGSMAVIASLVDSGMDILSGAILVYAEKQVAHADPYKYPAGNRRIEQIAVLLFACVMGMSAFMIIQECIMRLLEGFMNDNIPDIDLSALTLTVLILTIVVKAVLWLLCQRVADSQKSGAVEAYAQDHLNDVFTNFFGAAALFCATQWAEMWWLDPAGAVLIEIWIIISWMETGYEQFALLSGVSASPNFLQELTYISLEHDQAITAIDTVKAYHCGEGFTVEVDIVLPPSTPLTNAHNIGEALQNNLEQLEDVQRAYVHIDFEWEHKPEHGPTGLASCIDKPEASSSSSPARVVPEGGDTIAPFTEGP